MFRQTFPYNYGYPANTYMNYEQYNVDMPDIERTKHMRCKILEDNMEQSTKDFFLKIIQDQAIITYIKETYQEWFLEKKIYYNELDVNLVTILYYCMDSMIIEFGENATSAYNNYAKVKRDRKTYIMKTIKEEYNGKATKNNPMYMHTHADAYFQLIAVDPSITSAYKTKTDYIDYLYLSICEWGKDSSKKLCEFFFYQKLPVKRRVDLLFTDLKIFILKYIIEINTGNYDIGLLSFPPSITEGIFAFKNQYYDTTVTIENGNAINAIPYEFEEDGQMTFNRTILTEVNIPLDEHTNSAGEEFLEIIKKEYGFVENTRGLSNFSLHIVGTIYSLLNATNLSQDWFYFADGKEFVRRVLQKGKITKRDCKKVRAELIKISGVRIETQKKDNRGNILQEANYKFFESVFDYNRNNTGEEVYHETHISQNTYDENADPLEDFDFINEDWSISIAPSAYLKEEWKKKKNTDIYDKLYKKVSNKVSEVVTIMFQQLRLENLETLYSNIDYSFLRNRLKGNGMKISVFKKELEKEILTLQTSYVIIKNYEFKKNCLYVEFLPLSEIEKEIYGFRKNSIEKLPV